jgi:hypothetical protein
MLFKLVFECLPDMLGSETTSSNLPKKTLKCSECFVELRLDLVSLLEIEISESLQREDLGKFPKNFDS